MPRIDMLKSPNVEERLTAFKELSEHRSHLITELLKIIDDWSEATGADVIDVNSSEYLAFLLLGDLRASETVPVIIRYIKVKESLLDSDSFEELISLDSYFPALRALVKIGNPSIRYLRETIARADDTLTIQLAIVGIIRIGGRELAQFHLNSLRNDVMDGIIFGRVDNVEKALLFLDIPTIVTELQPSAPIV